MMNSMMFDRRRAERFAQLLEEADAGAHRHGAGRLDDELAGYVRLGKVLRTDLVDGPEQGFRLGLRARLIATAERLHQERGGATVAEVPEPAPPVATRAQRLTAALRPQFSGRRARVAAVTGLVLGTVTLSGMSAASGSAMPGDALYGVKRSAENARLALAASDVSRGELYLQFARNRVVEAAGLRTERTQLANVLTDMDTETVSGVRLLTSAAATRHDTAALDAIDVFVHSQYPAVSGLGGTERIHHSLSLLDQVSERSETLRQALACGTASTQADTLGPVPSTCDGSDETAQRRPASVPQGPSHRPETTPLPSTPSPGASAGDVAPSMTPTHGSSPAPSAGGLLGGVGRLLGGL